MMHQFKEITNYNYEHEYLIIRSHSFTIQSTYSNIKSVTLPNSRYCFVSNFR